MLLDQQGIPIPASSHVQEQLRDTAIRALTVTASGDLGPQHQSLCLNGTAACVCSKCGLSACYPRFSLMCLGMSSSFSLPDVGRCCDLLKLGLWVHGSFIRSTCTKPIALHHPLAGAGLRGRADVAQGAVPIVLEEQFNLAGPGGVPVQAVRASGIA